MVSQTKKIRVQYYALLREARGCSQEELETQATTAEELYQELKRRYHFSLPQDVLKVAINEEFQPWNFQPQANDTVVFIPPVAGG
jgi:molybdopterin converting factor subunit 1